MPNNRREPLSSLTLNQQNERLIPHLYQPLGPRIDHIAQPLLPCQWENSEVTGLRIFELFWDSEVVNVVVEGTNAYGDEKGAGGGCSGRVITAASGDRSENTIARVHSHRCRPWKKVTAAEIRVFLALLIYMGARREGGSHGFWKGRGERGAFQAMSLERFSQIKRFLHISNPKLQLSCAEWFQKLERLNSMIRSRCQQFYFPASNVIVDEMMIRFGGRSHHTYRMPSRPITEGYKVFALCDIGYTFDWIFASRVDSSSGLDLQKDLTPTGSTVFQLARSLPYTTGHFNIYMDNYFTSQQLLARLRDLGIGGCGTARVSRSAFPPELDNKQKNIPWNEVSGGTADSAGKVLALQWQDNSAVHFLSTIHTLEAKVISERKKPRYTSSNGPAIRRVFGSHERVNIPIPGITDDYNQFKVGVDLADQYRSYYFTQLKCLRNWPPIFYWLLDTTVINSYLLMSRLPTSTPTSIPTSSSTSSPTSSSSLPYQLRSSRVFRQALAESIIKIYGHKQQRPRKSYYTWKTLSPRYSKLQQRTSLSSPRGPKEDHAFSKIRDSLTRLECTQCRFTLRGMRQKGIRAPRTIYGCLGPGCGFSLCESCFNIRHKNIFSQ